MGDSLAMQQQIAPSCWSASCQTCCPFCFWSSATRVRLSSPIGPGAVHTQPWHCPAAFAGSFGCGFAHRWIAQNGDLPGTDSDRSRGQQVGIPDSAELRCVPPDGGRGGRIRGFADSWSACGPSPSAFPLSVRFPFAVGSGPGQGRRINYSGCTRSPHSGTVL
ncbi:hypothetical protein N431DRAFT_87875 [Stipitochalara longipes BDJ]|nr:hypothetical protein N431DRAFT_87875 [Stipitochalara longipes BDJ]